MLRWMLKTMWLQKTSVFFSAFAVAAAFALVVILDAVFVGESNHIVAYARNMSANIWVMQKDVGNMHMATSFVLDWKAQQIGKLPGIKRVTPILYVNTVIKAGGKNFFAYVIGLQADATRAGPWAMTAGKPHPQASEIVLPDIMANITGLDVGDHVRIADKAFTVVGLSKETFSMANSIAFVNFSDLEDLLETSGMVSFILVDIEPGQNPDKLVARIEQEIDKITALTQEEFIQNDFQIALLMGVEIIFFMTIIGSVLAALIVGFIMYSQVTRRRKELAVAKALGVNNRMLYMTVVIQAFVVTGVGLAIALLLLWGLVPLISYLIPQVTLDVTATAIMRLCIIALSVAVLTAWLPAHFVARVDPVTAFKV